MKKTVKQTAQELRNDYANVYGDLFIVYQKLTFLFQQLYYASTLPTETILGYYAQQYFEQKEANHRLLAEQKEIKEAFRKLPKPSALPISSKLLERNLTSLFLTGKKLSDLERRFEERKNQMIQALREDGQRTSRNKAFFMIVMALLKGEKKKNEEGEIVATGKKELLLQTGEKILATYKENKNGEDYYTHPEDEQKLLITKKGKRNVQRFGKYLIDEIEGTYFGTFIRTNMPHDEYLVGEKVILTSINSNLVLPKTIQELFLKDPVISQAS